MRWVANLRTFSAWTLLLAIVSLFISSYWISENYPGMWYAPSPPAPPPGMIRWRMISFEAVLIGSLSSIPKWQSWIGFASMFVWAFFFARD